MHHLAQLNIARMRAPLEDPLMADFVASLHPVNARAEASPGFVWRLQTVDGNATTIRAFDDPSILVNMSVWESVGALRAFVSDPMHLRMLRQRSSWFVPMDEPHLVLWWIPEGTFPTLEEARDRLERLGAAGPGPDAFNFARPFAAPGRVSGNG